VSKTYFKQPRVKLDPASYDKLRRQTLQRDGLRCQVCGSMKRLEVHHLEFRSHCGDDSEENLITLCAECHAQMHLSGQLAAYGGTTQHSAEFTPPRLPVSLHTFGIQSDHPLFLHTH
jgi:hypothetical protein